MDAMANPPHPGETVRFDCIEASGLTITEAARQLATDALSHAQRPRRNFRRHGARSGAPGLEHRRLLDAPPSCLRPRAGAPLGGGRIASRAPASRKGVRPAECLTHGPSASPHHPHHQHATRFGVANNGKPSYIRIRSGANLSR